MNNKKRIIIIITLISFGILVIGLTKNYEHNYITNKKQQIIKNRYMPFIKTKNFKQENKERYVRFYEKNRTLTYQDTVTRVNIGLDYEYYGYIKETDITKNEKILINKYLKLNNNYIPKNLSEINSKYFITANQNRRLLTKEAKEAFEKLSQDSIKNGTPVYGQSAYRSYEEQEIIYNNSVKNIGKERTDLDTARPGHSEHQTGLTIDVSSTKNGNMLEFENTDSFTWMTNNAHKYGFILRYPKGKETIHGYIYEAWHYRYVGKKIANDMHNNYSNLTYDEYYYMFIDS